MHFSTTSKNTHLHQIVDHALCSLSTAPYELSVETDLAIPFALQYLMCQPGLILLSVSPGMGCTSLALNTALSIAKFPKRTDLHFSFDSTKEMLMKKMLCIEGLVDIRRIWDQEFTDADWVRLTTASKLIKTLPLHIYDAPLLTFGEIKQICAQYEYVDLVIIDSLQTIQATPGEQGTPKRTKTENRILQQISIWAKEKSISILCLNTLGHDTEIRVCKESDVCGIRKYRKSFDAIDTALFLYREDYYETKPPEELLAYCYVRLARNNGYRRIRMRWIPEYTTFLDIPFCHAE